MAELFPMHRSASFSTCKVYRYTLERVWDIDLPRLLWILLNPSTADAVTDDPTNRRGVGFSKLWGYGSCIFANLNAFRATDPKAMKAAADPVGPLNDSFILREARLADRIVLAWGASGGHRGRDREVLELLAGESEMHGPAPKLWCLGKTKAGYPKHPLYLKADTKLELFHAEP